MDNHETYLSSAAIPSNPLTHEKNDTLSTAATVTVSSNSAAYATVAVSITVPVNLPTGVQPVMYSNITGDITKVLLNCLLLYLY